MGNIEIYILRLLQKAKQSRLLLNQARAGCGRRVPGFLELLLSAKVCVCVCPPPRLLITSGVMWCDIDPI